MTNQNTFSPAVELDALGLTSEDIDQLGLNNTDVDFSGIGMGAFRQGMIDYTKEPSELSSVSELLARDYPYEYAHGINASKFIVDKMIVTSEENIA